MFTAGTAPNPELVQISNQSVAYIITTDEQWEVAFEELKSAMGVRNVIGLDVEHLVTSENQPRENRNACPDVPEDHRRVRNIGLGRDPLLQLGVAGVAVLVRLCFFEKPPQSLVDFLENRDIIKVGVDILEDAQRLKVHWHLRVVSCLDLRLVCLESRRFCQEFPFYSFSLKSIGAFLGQDIEDGARDWRLACSNWAAMKLEFNQIAYAARDALAAAGSYEVLLTKFLPASKCKHSPRTAEFWEYHWHRRFKKYVNVPFTDTKISKYQKKGGGKENAAAAYGEIKPKQYRKLAETMHKSDSDVDVDFEEEKRKRLNRLQPIDWVGFYPEGTVGIESWPEKSGAGEAEDSEESIESGTEGQTASDVSVSVSSSVSGEKECESSSKGTEKSMQAETDSTQQWSLDSESARQEIGDNDSDEEAGSRPETDGGSAVGVVFKDRENDEHTTAADVEVCKLEEVSKCGIGSWNKCDSTPYLMMEKDLVDWCFQAGVKGLALTSSSSASGTKQRYRVKIEIDLKPEM